MRRVRALALACLLVGLSTGCISFNARDVEHSQPPLFERRVDDPPSVELVIGDWVRTLDGEIREEDASERGGRLARQMVSRWASQGVVRRHRGDGEPDYTLRVDGEYRGAGSPTLTLFSALTLFVFPFRSTNTYDLELVLEKHATGQVYDLKASNGWILWSGLVLVPVSPFGVLGAIHSRELLFDHVYDAFEEQRAWAPAPESAAP